MVRSPVGESPLFQAAAELVGARDHVCRTVQVHGLPVDASCLETTCAKHTQAFSQSTQKCYSMGKETLKAGTNAPDNKFERHVKIFL